MINLRLTGLKKVAQIRYLREMDKNYHCKVEGWELKNMELSRKIAKLFGVKAFEA